MARRPQHRHRLRIPHPPSMQPTSYSSPYSSYVAYCTGQTTALPLSRTATQHGNRNERGFSTTAPTNRTAPSIRPPSDDWEEGQEKMMMTTTTPTAMAKTSPPGPPRADTPAETDADTDMHGSKRGTSERMQSPRIANPCSVLDALDTAHQASTSQVHSAPPAIHSEDGLTHST